MISAGFFVLGMLTGWSWTAIYYQRRAKRFGIHIRTLKKYDPNTRGLFTFDPGTTEKLETFFSEKDHK